MGQWTDVIRTVLPVFVIIGIGVFCRSRKLITRAGIDTLAPEPVTLDNPLVSVGYGVTLSPHVAGVTTGVFVRSHGWFWENCVAVSEGRVPKNLVPGSYKG